ncbi:MAG TPA: hypothetical protein DCE41_24740 [Cytophagales bacterium]|nr:hypothetical protein [Cytophagales bacterium]HAP64488.1 hypothetical protein [Cytophagales bacterium]
MALIKKKKAIFPVIPPLEEFLEKYARRSTIPIHYADLMRYDNAIPLYDANDEDTLWKTVFYSQSEMETIHESLKNIYAMLYANGDLSILSHLAIDRVDLCEYGNTLPFRVRVINQINDNFDYFYIKQADASRIYGLELENILSPNNVDYLVHGQTLIEQHIAGVPGYRFMEEYLGTNDINRIRIAKEFVKFNERCFVRLLGDMHNSNYVIDITPDFEENHYRFRAIDFDQQCYEGRRSVYMPNYFKNNNPIIQMGIELMTPATLKQYQTEERANINRRARVSKEVLADLLWVMKRDRLAPPENVETLKTELGRFYKTKAFDRCQNMGEVLQTSLNELLNYPR